MPRTCTICNHAERQAIDKALLDGEPLRNIAQRFGTSTTALVRHKAAHLPQTLSKAKEAVQVAHADDLLSQMEALQQKTLAILSKAEGRDDHATALRAINEARRNLELLAELTHELNRNPQVNILLSPDWVRLRSLILAALLPYPEARQRVAAALLEAGDGRSA
ncbi:hypothetical protein [Anaerolinea sp.]|uniref:hypothetical protein n=1 Tax=Anaerolinea sp. TaxID=1872519 RepID=UPI002ACD44B7|nr:hypothetical protein [Anaerolinea sp.]